jgi:hypothetical protein
MSTYAKDMLDKISSNKNTDGNKMLIEKSNGSIVGSGIGLFLGLYFAHTRNWNYLFSASIGAVLGGLLVSTIVKRN